jgi:hypothetical protein
VLLTSPQIKAIHDKGNMSLIEAYLDVQGASEAQGSAIGEGSVTASSADQLQEDPTLVSSKRTGSRM